VRSVRQRKQTKKKEPKKKITKESGGGIIVIGLYSAHARETGRAAAFFKKNYCYGNNI